MYRRLIHVKGYLDRIEDNEKAVILIEEENTEIVVPIDELPGGSKEKTWFHIVEENGSFKIISIDDDMTEQKKRQSSDLMKKLRERKKESKFKK